MRRICQNAGKDLGEMFAVETSLIGIALVGSGFIFEAINAVDYIKATRLALIQPHLGVAFILILMSLVKSKHC